MFKLIAVRALEGCYPWISKCLKVGEIYYFNNDYYITDDGIRLRDEYVRLLPDDFFSLNGNSTLQINISAVVGMNGDGKSTLVELVMRLINNCAKHYRLADKDNLLRVDGVKAELYYLLDNDIYCIKEEITDNYTSILKYADVSNSDVRQWKKLMTPVRGVSRLKELFYTIVSNYSHYAYNTKDFKAEWNNNLLSNEDSEKCWLHYLFHKNDGYRTPMTIHPYRYEGNIDVNREIELTMQRLMALYIQEPNPRENDSSFRKIGNKEADFLLLEDCGNSKLHEITIVQYFKDNKSRSSLSKQINDIEELRKSGKDITMFGSFNNVLYTIKECLDFLIGEKEVTFYNLKDQSYKDFLSDFNELMRDKRKVYSSNSDLRQFLNALKKLSSIEDIPDKMYEQFAKKYKRYDKMNLQQLKRLRLIYDVTRSWGFPIEILTKKYEELNDIERCQHYVVYKTISICSIYPEYRDLINEKDSGWNNLGLVFDNAVIDEVVQQLKSDKTHVTLKLRQCLNFINQLEKNKYNVFEKLSNDKLRQKFKEESKNVFVISFDDLKSNYKKELFPLELLPPPIYKAKIYFRSIQHEDTYIPYMYLSSGEKQLLNNFGALIYHLRNIDSVIDEKRSYENVNVIFEEIELYFHPEYQRMVVKMLVEKLQAIEFRHIKRVNVIVVTHSPFILSDIPICNVLFLKDGKSAIGRIQENTFGANIHGLLKNGFFLPSLPMGEFAYDKINELFERLNGYKLNPNSEQQKDWFYSNIMRVGEPYLREQLMKLYNMHYLTYDNDRYKKK